MPRPHPAKALIYARGDTIAAAARACGMPNSPGVFGRVINGHQKPWPKLRRRVAEYLGVDEAEAWNADEDVDVVV